MVGLDGRTREYAQITNVHDAEQKRDTLLAFRDGYAAAIADAVKVARDSEFGFQSLTPPGLRHSIAAAIEALVTPANGPASPT